MCPEGWAAVEGLTGLVLDEPAVFDGPATSDGLSSDKPPMWRVTSKDINDIENETCECLRESVRPPCCTTTSGEVDGPLCGEIDRLLRGRVRRARGIGGV